MTDSDATFTAAIIATLLVLLAAAVVTDLKSHRIPNILLAPALSIALLVHALHGGTDGLVMAVGGLALGVVMFLPLYLVGGMAAGDVKLLGVVGCFLGPWGAVVAGLATMMAGAVFGIIAIAWRRFRPEFNLHATQMPNAPDGETHGSADLAVLRSQQRFTHIAYAPAITAGTIAALWYIGFLPERFLG
jgi:prepilin peptidase CpaA